MPISFKKEPGTSLTAYIVANWRGKVSGAAVPFTLPISSQRSTSPTSLSDWKWVTLSLMMWGSRPRTLPALPESHSPLSWAIRQKMVHLLTHSFTHSNPKKFLFFIWRGEIIEKKRDEKRSQAHFNPSRIHCCPHIFCLLNLPHFFI